RPAAAAADDDGPAAGLQNCAQRAAQYESSAEVSASRRANRGHSAIFCSAIVADPAPKAEGEPVRDHHCSFTAAASGVVMSFVRAKTINNSWEEPKWGRQASLLLSLDAGS